ncbi:MAG: Gfo/Idh/MocA family oxidoreductase [Bryobacterales bacterium]|nr:Gfo/Idh/MocA family oxidoreductase [Bryobacteraceae bacterium]MDW8130403.1 Gfo/Idh/MocA family oxidoreductase [Bryobacterales bacterium]
MNEPTITRRSLVTLSGTLAAPSLLRSRQPSHTVRIAFVGTGNRGTYLLRTMLQIPGVQVVAVCDIVEERAAKAAELVSQAGGSARVWTDFRKMLDEQKDIDAVVQATPDYTHRDVNIAILEVGKHLYAEKPLALTPEDCRMIVRAAEQAKGIFQVGFQLRHDPRRNAAMKFIHGGGIGRVLLCHGIRHGGDLPRQIPWYFDRTKSGDILIDQGIHILDLFTWAIGSHPARALASGGTDLFVNEPPGRTVMDNYSLIFEYPGGQRVNFSHHYFDPPGFTGIRELVFGSEGAVDLPAAAWQPRTKKGLIKLEVADADKSADYMSLAAFLENIRSGNRKPLNDAHSALRATLQAIMGTRAIYERRIVTWEEVAGSA